jgi:hypothetical protein
MRRNKANLYALLLLSAALFAGISAIPGPCPDPSILPQQAARCPELQKDSYVILKGQASMKDRNIMRDLQAKTPNRLVLRGGHGDSIITEHYNLGKFKVKASSFRSVRHNPRLLYANQVAVGSETGPILYPITCTKADPSNRASIMFVQAW